MYRDFSHAEKERTAWKLWKFTKWQLFSLKQQPRSILRENFVNLLIFSSSSFFLSIRKITWLNSHQPKTRGYVEHLNFILGVLPFFLYDLPFQREMDVNDLVLDDDPKKRSMKRYKTENENNIIIPYRDLSAAYTIMLQLCKPELRDFHRSVASK